MKMFLAICFMMCFIASCAQQEEEGGYIFTSFREPADEGLYLASSKDGLHWQDLGGPYLKPEAGKSKIMRDPSIVRGPDGTYHMVWTTDWRGGNGFGYASSKDLIDWSPQEYIPVMEHEPTVVNVWAPELFYDDDRQGFIIIWASTVPHRYEKGEEDEDNNHRMYYVTTKDFKTFSKAKLFLEPGFSVIDAVIVKRKMNDYVLVLKDNTRPMRNLKISFAKSPLGPFEKISEPFTGFLSEGPTVLKLGKEWVIYYDNYGEKNYRAVKTVDFENFEPIDFDLPEGHKHGTIAPISGNLTEKLLESSKSPEQE